ncbi:Dehydrogenase/reductase SDR family member 11 [Blattella germanica]|nr:Dehydrogenase/reductase SDR family member 11 [Blattella germanica]
MERWAGRVAVVTGASSGIGAAIAEELVKKGLKVIGLARRVERIEELSNSLASAPGNLHGKKCDISNEGDVRSAFAWIKEQFGGVDILGPLESWKTIFDVNVIALSFCTMLAIKSMKEQGVDGHIVHINSLAGHSVPPPILPIYMYSASKHAVTALTEGLRSELETLKLKIRSISPGVVATEMMPEERIGAFPHMKPKDIAEAVIFALSAPQHVQLRETVLPECFKLYFHYH